MKAIILRTNSTGTQYLDWRYRWTSLPTEILFPLWQLSAVVGCAPEATGLAVVDDTQPIDLDRLEVMPL